MRPIERLELVFSGKAADRTPVLGGWIACPEHICSLTGVTLDKYWDDPVSVSIEAYKVLQCDGLIDILVPKNRDDYRIVDENDYCNANHGLSLSEAIAAIDRMPSPVQIEANFDFEAEYNKFRADLICIQAKCGDIVYMPAQWGAGAKVNWYSEFGYENFFLIVGLYPEYADKLFQVGGATGRCRSTLIARAVEEGIYPHAVLLGEDICDQRGPMISPEFLENYYMPQLSYGLKPLLDVGCKPVWHSDGDVRPLLDMLIDAGIEGFQGFQPECGMNLDILIEKRTKNGDPLLIFGPISVTTELPVLDENEIQKKVSEAIEKCRGKASLVLFTSNTINPDVPLKNITSMYQAVKSR